MTPEQRIMSAILLLAIEDDTIQVDSPITADNVDDLYDDYYNDDLLYDYKYQFREGQIETGIPCEHSRHYESKSVAAQASGGSWVGWTYWYGGGKHGEPEAIDWMESAYNLNCVEEEKMVVVQTFTEE
jgi:hypothetical protein